MTPRMIAGVGCCVLLSSAAVAAPCGGFVDVDDANPAHAPFCDSVEWMKNRAITFGLTPTLYDPNSFVTRLQMAAFMYRLGFQNAFLQGGNSFGATTIVGTEDNQPLELHVNGSRAMRYEPNAISPNVIGGSPANNVTAGVRGATIAGGGVPAIDIDPIFNVETPNSVTDAYGTVGGGYGNRAGDNAGTVTSGAFATVVGGAGNTASGLVSTVAGGEANTASGLASTVVGGLLNIAAGHYSFAAGYAARANADGCFVWGDTSSGGNAISCNAADRFVVRSAGGVFFAAGTTQATYTGVVLPPGATAWEPASDRAIKENVHVVDTRDVLDRLLAMPVSTWNLKAQDVSIRHMGPMAQDFREAFGLGESETRISTLDADGVAFAAIQGLNAKHEAERAAKDAEIASLRAELAAIRSLFASRSSP